MFRSEPLTLKNRWDLTAGETGDDGGTDENKTLANTVSIFSQFETR